MPSAPESAPSSRPSLYAEKTRQKKSQQPVASSSLLGCQSSATTDDLNMPFLAKPGSAFPGFFTILEIHHELSVS